MAAPQVEKPEYLPEQINRHAGQRARADIDNVSFIMSDAVKDKAGNIVQAGPIGSQKPPQIGTGLAAAGQQLQTTLLDMAGTGQSTVPSNAAADAIKQVNERQDDAFQPLMQNSMSALKSACEAWIDGAQLLYFSNERSLRVQSQDGSYSQVKTLEYEMNDKQEYGPFKNSCRGKYTVQVKVGESYKNKKEAELETTLKMLQYTDANSPQGQMLLNQAIMSTTGEGGSSARKVARYQMMNDMMMMGIDPEPENEEEEAYVERKMQEMSQPKPPTPFEQAELNNSQAKLLEQQNREAERAVNEGKVMLDAQGKQEKLESDLMVAAKKLEQEDRKIDNAKEDDIVKNAISIREMELKSNQEQNANIAANMQTVS